MKEQGLLRTKKYRGAERWKLRHVVEALPTLILVSLGLFFIAMTDYIWAINREVAILITGFSGAGIVSYLMMLIAAALSPDCPFQTAPSTAFFDLARLSILGLHNILIFGVYATVDSVNDLTGEDHWFRKVYQVVATWKREQWTHGALLWLPNSKPPESAQQLDRLYTESAQSILAIAPRNDTLMSLTHNIPAIQDFTRVQKLAHSQIILSFAGMLGATMLNIQASPSDAAEEKALVVARALAHLLLADPTRHGREGFRRALIFDGEGGWSSYNTTSLVSADLKVLLVCILTLCDGVDSTPLLL